jgi:hypothetical protein
MTAFKFKLGEKVRDRITGIEGIVLANTDWLTGCNTVTIRPSGLKDGVPHDTVLLDEPMVERIGPGVTETIKPPTDARLRGGPRPSLGSNR